MIATKVSRLTDDMRIHRSEQLLSRRGRREIELRIQSIKLENIVVEWSGTSTGSKVLSTADAGTLSCAIGQITGGQPFSKALCRARNIPCCPVKRIRCGGTSTGVRHVVEDHGVGLKRGR